MVDFKKRLGKKKLSRPIKPLEIYSALDRESDKGPLRPIQEAILEKWFAHHREDQDVILKLNTGQGKTLIGMIMLQSRLNELQEPVLYLCPNKFLAAHTCTQARQFGIKVCSTEGALPSEFYNADAILVTHVQKLFNGKTQFGLRANSTSVSTLLVDDAHTCIDSIRAATKITLASKEPAYGMIRDLFDKSLKEQGMGTYADLRAGEAGTTLLVPYWDWDDKHEDVVAILSKYKDTDTLRFVWPLLRDRIADCQCVISGTGLEIEPYLAPLEDFGTFTSAKHRVYMSATIADDAFLVKGLGVEPAVIRNPLIYEHEKWSGEKMVLIPSLIGEKLTRAEIVRVFARERKRRAWGAVALTRSFKNSKDWEQYGALVATSQTIESEIQKLRDGKCERTLVIANRYDGIDLPDQACRLLIIDSRPWTENLIDQYVESVRPESDLVATRLARTIEQGLGRSVRGEKDYCVFIITGPDLVRYITRKDMTRFLSSQTRAQIQIGLDVAEYAKEEAGDEVSMQELIDLAGQCLKRGEDWKAFYVERMDAVQSESDGNELLAQLSMELDAEKSFVCGDVDKATATVQSYLDTSELDEAETGWYFQHMARYQRALSEIEADKLQQTAHARNGYLLKPRIGMTFKQLNVVSLKRTSNIIDWVGQFTTYADLLVALTDVLDGLSFGVRADRFERAWDNVGEILGFEHDRPDKIWKEGPDNLWGLAQNSFLVVECKNQVELTRSYINKHETAQLNGSIAWFQQKYKGAHCFSVMIIPTHKVQKGAYFVSDDVGIMNSNLLSKFKKRIIAFISEFRNFNLQELSEEKVQSLIDTHKLTPESVARDFVKRPVYADSTSAQ